MSKISLSIRSWQLESSPHLAYQIRCCMFEIPAEVKLCMNHCTMNRSCPLNYLTSAWSLFALFDERSLDGRTRTWKILARRRSLRRVETHITGRTENFGDIDITTDFPSPLVDLLSHSRRNFVESVPTIDLESHNFQITQSRQILFSCIYMYICVCVCVARLNSSRHIALR